MLHVIPESLAKASASTSLAFEAAKQALQAAISEQSELLPVVLGSGPYNGSNFAIKSGSNTSEGLLGLKVGTYWPENHKRDVPNHGSTILLLDTSTGMPSALINASYLNGLRTAAADAVAVDLLSNPNAEVLCVVGAGHQSEFDVRAILEVRDIREINIWNRGTDRSHELAEKLEDTGVKICVKEDCKDAVSSAQIVTTITASNSPIIQSEWVAPGTHISAMGADAIGKQELFPEVLEKSSCFADLPEQSIRIGEFQHLVDPAPLKQITALGSVILGLHPGRTDAQEVTVFDSSGIALQDLFIAAAVLSHVQSNTERSAINF